MEKDASIWTAFFPTLRRGALPQEPVCTPPPNPAPSQCQHCIRSISGLKHSLVPSKSRLFNECALHDLWAFTLCRAPTQPLDATLQRDSDSKFLK